MEGAWTDNVLNVSFTTYGFKITATLTVKETVVSLNGKIPFPAVAFRGKIEQTIADELKKALAK